MHIFKEQLLETFILLINITMNKKEYIENLYSSMYNGQYLVWTCDTVCSGNGRFSTSKMMVK